MLLAIDAKSPQGQPMTDDLTKIDRWNSEPLDVHVWSDHPEIKSLCEEIYADAGITSLEPKGNRSSKRKVKEMLRVLLIDIYVKWLNNPSLSIGFSKNKNSYLVNSRYNRVHISEKIIKVEELLESSGYIEELRGYRNAYGTDRSYTTRIRHTEKLRIKFKKLSVDYYDIDHNVNRELIQLSETFKDKDRKKKKALREYCDTDYTNSIREQLARYNELLKISLIDIPTQAEPFIRRQITSGDRKGQEQRISIGPNNKHVHRVFNGKEVDNWTKGGRFFGGWWQQIPKEMRKSIYICDQPTVEVDYKALHPNLLLTNTTYDPYDVGKLILPEIINNKQKQRAIIKSLILMAINADSATIAYAAFRRAQKVNDPAKKMKNNQLQKLLDAFTDKYPEIKDALNTGQALKLMNIDSVIANMVINYFTQKQVPVLCIHDSFIIDYKKETELRRVLYNASVQVTGKNIEQDSEADTLQYETYVQGNIKGYEKKKPLQINIPKRIEPTKEYKLRRSRHDRWMNS